MSTQTPGFSAWRVIDKQPESAIITSFVLAPADGISRLDFRPGQFLTLRLILANNSTLLRNYSFSACAAKPGQVRISVKREPAPLDQPQLPPGLGSNHLHDCVQTGDLLQVAGPSGTFVLDELSTRPVLLFSGGVGLTPMVSMLHSLSRDSSRAVYFVHACENSTVHALRDEVLALADRRPGINVHFCYRTPGADDRSRYHSEGLITRQTLQQLLPLDDYDVYLCGPRPFMQANWRLLRSLGVARERIHYEFFGPAAVLEEDEVSPLAAPVSPPTAQRPEADTLSVCFMPSGTRVVWDENCHSLLELAEQAGLEPAFNCRAGLCNTCQVRLQEGTVEYLEEPLEAPQHGDILLCCTRPTSAITVQL